MSDFKLESKALPDQWIPDNWKLIPSQRDTHGAIFIGKKYKEINEQNVTDFCNFVTERCEGKEIAAWLALPTYVTMPDYEDGEGPTLNDFFSGDVKSHPVTNLFIAYPVLKEV